MLKTITPGNIVYPVAFEHNDFEECLSNASAMIKSMNDRCDLHARSILERLINVLMGEISERAVVNWLVKNGKYAVPARKNLNKPDDGYDIILRDTKGNYKRCSVKSSLSVYKNNPEDILNMFQLSSKRCEIQDVNIQVYFWLNPGNNKTRVTVPSTDNMAVIGWIGKKCINNFVVGKYKTEKRETVNIKLTELHPMETLLKYLS